MAKHCQEGYCAEESEFGYYHFREVQRDANTSSQSLMTPLLLPLPPSTLQQQQSRQPSSLSSLRKKSFTMQKRRNDSERFGAGCGIIKTKENEFGWKCSQSLNSAL